MYRLSDRDHTADVRLAAFGDSLENCFISLGLGMFNYMTDINSVEEVERRELRCHARNLEMLVYQYLNELLGLYGEDYFIARSIGVEKQRDTELVLQVVCLGEIFDRHKHTMGTEVKAITMHEIQIGHQVTEKSGNALWLCEVLLDI